MRLVIVIGLLALAIIISGNSAPAGLGARSVCDVSRDLSAYRDKLVVVRGVYYYGLRQTCPGICATGPWPSSLDLVGTGHESWAALEKADQLAELEAKKGNRVEIWVTAVGWLRTMASQSPLGPCDTVGSHYYGYGHLGAFPARLEVQRFSDVEIRGNPASPFDYSRRYSGPF